VRIVVCNKYYFETGGPERYMFGITQLLQDAGHEVIPFSVDAARNRPSPYAPYFVSSPVGRERYDARLTQQPLGMADKLRITGRAIYSFEARASLRALVRDTRPDLVYVLNFSSYLSPSILGAARAEGVPVVVRLSDFGLLCANNVFLRDGRPCTECLEHGKWRGAVHRCCAGSLAASAATVLAMYSHDALGVYRHVDAFVAPAQFTRQKMIEGGFAAEKIHHIPTFVDTNRFRPRAAGERDDGYVLYFGRIAPEMGLASLVEAQALLGPPVPPLLLAGRSEPAEEARLRARCAELGLTNVEFLGPRQGDDLVRLVQRARCTVLPSICFNNTPNAVYEAFACARPVVASRIGSLPEQVVHERNGLLFAPDDPADLARQLARLLADPARADELGAEGHRIVSDEYTGAVHARRLLALFDRLVGRRGEAAVAPPAGATGRR
jgi:glycosyltransferase involved in cell wall biosynthesis